jgi:serine/threonine-protein kinase
MTTEAVVNVKALQKSLNQMSRDERVEFIRAGGDPKIAVRVVVRDADSTGAAAQALADCRESVEGTHQIVRLPHVVGRRRQQRTGPGFPRAGRSAGQEALAQARSFGGRCHQVHAYVVDGEMRGPRDRRGNLLQYDVAQRRGSWASEGEALKAIGTIIADEFSKSFFLQHLNVTGRKVTLSVDGLPNAKVAETLGRQLVGLPAVITAAPRGTTPNVFDLQLGGSGPEGELVANSILKPLNAQLGQSCFALGAIAGDAVSVTFDKRCADAPILSRLDTNLPAGLYSAPPGRQKDVISDPETLKKLTI